MNFLRQPWRRLSVISVIAAILYCSWPYGPVLDPTIGLKGSASELAAPHHPYHWFFEYGDVIASVLMVIVCLVLAYRAHHTYPARRWYVSLGLLIGFGVFASIAALSPLQCLAAVQECTHAHPAATTVIHGMASVAGPFSLFWGLVYLWWQHRTWMMSGFLLVYAALGSATFIVQFLPGSDVTVQNIFISWTALSLAVYPYLFTRIYPIKT